MGLAPFFRGLLAFLLLGAQACSPAVDHEAPPSEDTDLDQGAIQGGEILAPTDPALPALAKVGIAHGPGGETCTGTLVTQDTVLTAGHCFEQVLVRNPSPFQVLVAIHERGKFSTYRLTAPPSVHPHFLALSRDPTANFLHKSRWDMSALSLRNARRVQEQPDGTFKETGEVFDANVPLPARLGFDVAMVTEDIEAFLPFPSAGSNAPWFAVYGFGMMDTTDNAVKTLTPQRGLVRLLPPSVVRGSNPEQLLFDPGGSSRNLNPQEVSQKLFISLIRFNFMGNVLTCNADSGGPLTFFDQAARTLRVVGTLVGGYSPCQPGYEPSKGWSGFVKYSTPDAREWLARTVPQVRIR